MLSVSCDLSAERTGEHCRTYEPRTRLVNEGREKVYELFALKNGTSYSEREGLALGLGTGRIHERKSIDTAVHATNRVCGAISRGRGAAAQGDTDAGEMVALPPTAYRLPVRSALACARGAPR